MLIEEYFTQKKGFDRLLTDMAVLYARHGRIYGAVRLANPTAEEEECLSQFFDRDYFNQALIRISLGDFARQLEKKSCVELEVLLTQYLDKLSEATPVSNKDAFTEELIKTLLAKYENTPAWRWLTNVAAHKRRTYKVWVQQYASEPIKILSMLDNVATMLNNLPQTMVSLAKFSSQFLGSPYKLDIFDTNDEYNALFLRALAYHFNVAVPNTIEDTIMLYLKAGLLAGGALCQVAVQGMVDGADNFATVHVLTLENVMLLPQVKSHGGKLFIIENPHVFTSVCERLRDVNCTLMCPMGSHNPAFLLLIAQFFEQGDTLYYSGNMDYKGLAQADKLFLKFGKQFVPWRYSKEDYELAVAAASGLLPDEKKNLSMHHDDLALVLSQMRKKGRVANSMPLVPLLVEDVCNLK